MYEESLKIPFIVKWPGIVKAGSRNSLVQNLDYARTFLEIANAPQPKDGKTSLVPKVKLQKTGKGNILHYYEYPIII